MKKWFIVAMTAMLCVSIAMPAAADVSIQGSLWVDAYIRSMDNDSQTLNTFPAAYGGAKIPGRIIEGTPLPGTTTTTYGKVTDLQVNMPYSQTYINFAYFNKTGTVGGNFTLLGGGVNDWVSWTQMGTQAHIWFKPSKTLTVRLGKLDQFIGGLAPNANIGNAEYYRKLYDPANSTGVFDQQIAAGPTASQVPAAITFGNLHTTAKYGLDVAFAINKNLTFKVALFEPDVDGTINFGSSGSSVPAGAAGTRGVIEDSTIPRVDVGLPMRFGKFYIQPKASYLYKTLQNMPAGSDDSYDVYVFGADASIQLGPITLMGEYTYGQNLGASNHTGGLSTQGPRAYADGGVYKIADEKNYMWWAEVDWAITNKFMVRAAYGQHDMEMDGSPASTNDDVEFDRSFYAVSLRWAVQPNVFIVPIWMRHDFGQPKLGVGALGIQRVDMGRTDYYGISTVLMF